MTHQDFKRAGELAGVCEEFLYFDVLPEEISGTALRSVSPHESSRVPFDQVQSPKPKVQSSRLARTEDLEGAQLLANTCEEFLRLTQECHMPITAAARALGKSPGYFSGPHSMLARYQREGLAGLVPQRKADPGALNCGDLTRWIESLGWFVPAARHFNSTCNRTYESGSMPEAVRRTISMPVLPIGWTRGYTERFLKAIGCAGQAVPICPPELRETILQRERAGLPLVPERVNRQIAINKVIMAFKRRPHEAALNFLSASGTGMIVRQNGDSWVARGGDSLTADDGTINFPVCVPFTTDNGAPIIINPCTEKYGVMVGRFQWLRSIDVGTRFRPGWVFVARPRSSYRGADVLTLLRGLTLQHGVWGQYCFERGVWQSHLVQNCLKLMGARLNTVFSPHAPGKVFIEGGFNSDWTKLSVQFPQCDLGRYRGDTEECNKLLQECRAGRRDPRRLFPMLADVMRAFDAITREQNQTRVNSAWGRWVPAERYTSNLQERPLRQLPAELEFAFAPYAITWTVRGHLVGGRVPLFEEMSVPFDFEAPWLMEYHGAKLRVHFDPSAPKCLATAILTEPWQGKPAGTILGTLSQVNETAGYIRKVMGWGEDDSTAGLRARQAAAKAVRLEMRTLLPTGKSGQAASERHDGIGTFARVEVEGPRSTVEKAEGTGTTPTQRMQDDFIVVPELG